QSIDRFNHLILISPFDCIFYWNCRYGSAVVMSRLDKPADRMLADKWAGAIMNEDNLTTGCLQSIIYAVLALMPSIYKIDFSVAWMTSQYILKMVFIVRLDSQNYFFTVK